MAPSPLSWVPVHIISTSHQSERMEIGWQMVDGVQYIALVICHFNNCNVLTFYKTSYNFKTVWSAPAFRLHQSNVASSTLLVCVCSRIFSTIEFVLGRMERVSQQSMMSFCVSSRHLFDRAPKVTSARMLHLHQRAERPTRHRFEFWPALTWQPPNSAVCPAR